MVKVAATCLWCLRDFTYERRDPRGRVRRWCSEKCRYAQRDLEDRPPCAGGCGGYAWTGKGSREDTMCRPCRTREQRLAQGLTAEGERECSWCGHLFKARTGRTRSHRKYCSSAICQSVYRLPSLSSPWSPDLTPLENALAAQPGKRRDSPRRRAYQAARKKLRSSLAPGEGDEAIFTRDRWTCHLCDLPVSRTLNHPHPMSPSIDHLVPVDEGGTDEPANLATAHLACNVHKHTAAMGEQLRLVG
jgi:hypothetical protein